MKLEPCPFCGESEDIAVRKRIYRGLCEDIFGATYYYIECLPCDAQTGHCFDDDGPAEGYANGKSMAIAKWNRRTPNNTNEPEA